MGGENSAKTPKQAAGDWGEVAAVGTVAGTLLWIVYMVLATRGHSAELVAAVGALLLAISLPGAIRAIGRRLATGWTGLTTGASALLSAGFVLLVLFGLGYIYQIAEMPPWVDDLRFGFVRLMQGCMGAGMLGLGVEWKRSPTSALLPYLLTVAGAVGVFAAIMFEFPVMSVVPGLINAAWLITTVLLLVWMGVAAWPDRSATAVRRRLGD